MEAKFFMPCDVISLWPGCRGNLACVAALGGGGGGGGESGRVDLLTCLFRPYAVFNQTYLPLSNGGMHGWTLVDD